MALCSLAQAVKSFRGKTGPRAFRLAYSKSCSRVLLVHGPPQPARKELSIEPIDPDPASDNVSVSCLLVTLPVPERLPFVTRSIDDFCRQTVKNKNLVLVLSGGIESIHQAIRDYVASLDRHDIHIFTQPPDWNLGQLRNFSIENATGDVLCHWDDDDLYHPERLERQLSRLLEGNFEAVYLQEVMQHFPSLGHLYWTNWRATEAGGHPATLMVRREAAVRYSTEGSTARLGEDSEAARALLARGCVGYVTAMPHLYIYTSHGGNSWPQEHHRMLAEKLSISQALLRRREALIREGMAPHGMKSGTISVMGNNGPGFVL